MAEVSPYSTMLAYCLGHMYRHKLFSGTVIFAAMSYGASYLIFLASTLVHVVLSAMLFLYLLYYWVFLVQKPEIHCQESLYQFLKTYCPSVFRTYYPTVWMVGGHVRSFARGFIQRHQPVEYERETVTLDDGGILCLDWSEPLHQKRDSTKILLFMAGLTGGSRENYATLICHKANTLGYIAVVMNNRGCADAPLTTPKTYCASKTDDFRTVLSLVHKRYPDSPVFLVGISLGGVLMTHYLCEVGEQGEEAGVVGALCVSAPFDCVVTNEQLELPASLVTFNHFLTANLVKMIQKNINVFKKAADLPFDIDSVTQAKTLQQFDEKLVVPMFGYNSPHDYYVDASTNHRLHHILVPYLAMNAGDDPFAPDFALPVDKFSSSRYTAMLKTTVGGHIGFADSLWPSGPTLVDKVFTEFSTACFEHGNELKPMD